MLNLTPSIAMAMFSLLFSIYVYLSSKSKDNTTELTTVIVKLENIGNGITEIKKEIESMKDDQKQDHERLIELSSSLKAAWKRIDEMRGVEPK